MVEEDEEEEEEEARVLLCESLLLSAMECDA